MQVQFGTDGKRINSTKIPTLDTTVTCVLKRPCTVENPVLDVSTFNPRWSVAYIPDFHRYYFVSNIESISNSITRYHLTVDPMASFKQRILAHTLYVVRSQSMGSNKLVDPYATHTADNPNVYNMSWSLGNYNVSGFYVLQTAGKGTTSSIGEGVNTYLVTPASLRALINNLFTEGTFEDGSTTISGEIKTYFNPFQYIISCMWFPLDTSAVEMAASEIIKFGWWPSASSTTPSAYGNPIRSPGVISYTDFSLPSLVDWTASSPDFSRYNLFVPGVGSLEIDPCYAGLPLYCKVITDLLTGGCRCEIRIQDGNGHGTADPIIATANGYWGVNVMLTQLASDASNLPANIMNSASAVSGLTFAEGMEFTVGDKYSSGITRAITDVSFGILDAIPYVGSRFKNAVTTACQPALSVNGAVGNFSELMYFPYLKLTVKHYDVLEPNMNDVAGLPCHRKLLLSNLTGYTECNNASVSIQSATIQEKLTIKKYLEGGFWIE